MEILPNFDLLLMDHLDIDFHIYSADFYIADSFAAVGIEVYQAVIGAGVETFDEYQVWKANAQDEGVIMWEPNI